MAQSQTVQRSPREYSHSATTAGRAPQPTDWLIGWKPLFWGCALIMAANIFLWFWNYAFMFSAGLNSASPEFTRYYRTLFWGELLVLGVFTGIWYGWLIRTGREIVGQPCARAEEVRRIAILWSLIGATSLSVYIEASFWPNWDGSWHQTMVRDTFPCSTSSSRSRSSWPWVPTSTGGFAFPHSTAETRVFPGRFSC